MEHTVSKDGRIDFIQPMLAKRVPTLPEGPAWAYEVKFDGYRMQALKLGNTKEYKGNTIP